MKQDKFHIKKDKYGKPYRVGEGTKWFQRLLKDIKKISKHIRVKRIKYGFNRIYWQSAYIHEVSKEMPIKGYDKEDYDPRFESQSYYEQYEDNTDLTMKIKNFVEGYYDSLGTLQRRCYMMKNNWEFQDGARKAYRQMKIY